MSVPATGRPQKSTPRDIIAVAWALFEERGYEHVSMTEIAERAGVSRRTLFNHFPQKAALLFEPIEDFIARFRRELQAHPRDESIFDSFTGTFWTLCPNIVEALGEWNPGREVWAARLRDDAVNYWKATWATEMEALAVEFLGEDKRIQASFVGALTAQIWTEFTRLQLEAGIGADPQQTLARIFDALGELLRRD